MNYIKTAIEGVYIIEPKVFSDSRGYFMETWKQAEFNENVYKVDFMQENESKSSYGVVRGLHYQRGEFSQAKLVRVIRGCVVDVAVDLRRFSPTFGKHVMVELSDTNKRQLFIPRGFAHGFQVLSEQAVFAYKCDEVYHPGDEGGIRWDDADIGIVWPGQDTPILSEKDQHWPALRTLGIEL